MSLPPQLPSGHPSGIDVRNQPPAQKGGSEFSPVEIGKSKGKSRGKGVKKLVSKVAAKLFKAHKSVRSLKPNAVKTTSGLKDAPVKPLSYKALSERNLQALDYSIKPQFGSLGDLRRTESMESLASNASTLSRDSGLPDDDNLSISSFDSNASDIATLKDLDDGYSPVNRPSGNDSGYGTVNHGYVPGDIIEDLQYAESRSFTEPTTTPEPQTQDTVDQKTAPDEGIPEPDLNENSSPEGSIKEEAIIPEEAVISEYDPFEITQSKENVVARKMASFQEAVDTQNWEALDKKLANTNNYSTVKKVAQMAVDTHGKASFSFQIAQNRMAELKADQLMKDLDGMHLSADLDQVRTDARAILDATDHYKEGFRNKVMAHLETELVKFAGYQSETEEILNRPPVPERTAQMFELDEEVAPPPPPRQEQTEAPPLPPRPESPQSTETPDTPRSKRRNRLAQLFKRR